MCVFGIVVPYRDESVSKSFKESYILFVFYCVLGWGVYGGDSNAPRPIFDYNTGSLYMLFLVSVNIVMSNAASDDESMSAMGFSSGCIV